MAEARSFPVDFYEWQWDIITDALNGIQSKSQAQIKKARNFPSETIRSGETIVKHNNIINDIRFIQNKITEAYI